MTMQPAPELKGGFFRTIQFDIGELARALSISNDDVVALFSDGRFASHYFDKRLARELRGQPAQHKHAKFDIADSGGQKWEVRCVTKGSVQFAPSSVAGGAAVTASKLRIDFADKLKLIRGYLLCDIVNFPSVNVYCVPREFVERWLESGQLSSHGGVSRKGLFSLMDSAHLLPGSQQE